jgi:acetyl esterase/lipase
MVRLRSALALFLGAATLFLAVWVLIPGPTYFMLTFSVGGPEISLFYLPPALIAVVLGWSIRRVSRVARVAIAMAFLAIAISLTPILRLASTVDEFDRHFADAIGTVPASAVPAAQTPEQVRGLAEMRLTHFSLRDLVFGIPLGEAKITRGVAVAAPSGVPLTVNVYQPTVAGRYPILVQIYGGAWQRGTPDSFKNFAQWIAARGYVVFAIDYRHAPKFRWPAQLDDTKLMLAWIRDHAAEFGGDTSRVALMGRSAGAHLATIAAWGDEPPPLVPRAIVSYYGPVNLVESYKHPPTPDPIRVRETDEALIGGTLDQFPAAYADASPITHVTRKQVPTLLIYGQRDHIVQPEAGRMLRDKLSATGTPVVYLEIPWADHGFDEVFQGPSNQLALYYTERFLARVLAAR